MRRIQFGDFHIKSSPTALLFEAAPKYIINDGSVLINTDALVGTEKLRVVGTADIAVFSGTNGQTALGSGNHIMMDYAGGCKLGTSDAAGYLVFHTNTDVEAMRIDAAGNVGVGKSPTNFGAGYTVVESDGSNGGYFLASYGSGTTLVQFAANSVGGEVGTRTNSPMLLTTNNTEAMRILTNQAIAIGTTALVGAEKVRINGSAYIDDSATIDSIEIATVGSTGMRVGVQAGNSATGSNWVGLGYQAAYTNVAGWGWTALGYQAAYTNTGGDWTALGYQAGYTNGAGNSWTAVGRAAGTTNATGSDWTALGRAAGKDNSGGSDWVALGRSAGKSSTTGSDWTAVGTSAGYSILASDNWTALGHYAGRYQNGGTTGLSISANSLFLGYLTKGTQSATNENVIGYAAEGGGSNSVVLGNTSVTKTLLRSGVRINTTTLIGSEVLRANGDVYIDGDLQRNFSQGSLYVSTAAATATVTAGVPVNLLGNSTSSATDAAVNDFTLTAAGRLTYTGSPTKNFTVAATLSVSSGTNNRLVTFMIAKNGTVITNSSQARQFGTGTDVGNLTVLWPVSLANTDYVEVWVDVGASTTVTPEYCVFVARETC